MSDLSFLSHLYFTRVKVTFKASEPLELYEYMGSAYRGCFGQSLRELECHRRGGDCTNCREKFSCAFSQLYNSFTYDDHPWHRKYPKAPHPYIISPVSGGATQLRIGDNFGFELSLIGQSITYVPALWNVFREMGNIGIGKGRKKFTFEGLHALHSDGLYHPLSFFDELPSLSIENLPRPKVDKHVKLHLETPLRLKNKRELVTSAPPFGLLAERIALRLGLLAHFHCGAPWPGENFELNEEMTKLAGSEVIPTDWRRYSGTQDTTMKFDGITGALDYTGNFTQETIDLFLWGSWLHAGSTATFGLGRYNMKG